MKDGILLKLNRAGFVEGWRSDRNSQKQLEIQNRVCAAGKQQEGVRF
jgi:hypothetical protein